MRSIVHFNNETPTDSHRRPGKGTGEVDIVEDSISAPVPAPGSKASQTYSPDIHSFVRKQLEEEVV